MCFHSKTLPRAIAPPSLSISRRGHERISAYSTTCLPRSVPRAPEPSSRRAALSILSTHGAPLAHTRCASKPLQAIAVLLQPPPSSPTAASPTSPPLIDRPPCPGRARHCSGQVLSKAATGSAGRGPPGGQWTAYERVVLATNDWVDEAGDLARMAAALVAGPGRRRR